MSKLEELQAQVRDLTHMVVHGDLPGLFVIGPGGLGKTHSVLQGLKECGLESPRTLNTHATAAGLYQELYPLRNEPLVLMEDLEQLYSSLPALSLLRSVLWGPKNADGRMVRTATWTTATGGSGGGEEAEVPSIFEFKAGIIMTANRFPKSEVFDSLRTRVPVIRFEVSHREVFAFMRQMVQGGYRLFDQRAASPVNLTEGDCGEVIAYLEKKHASDLRMLHHALTLFYRHRESGKWVGLLDALLASSHAQKKANGNEDAQVPTLIPELKVVAELLSKPELSTAKRIDLYRERTGKSRQSFFRRQKEIREHSESEAFGRS